MKIWNNNPMFFSSHLLSSCHLQFVIFIYYLQAQVKGSTWIPIFNIDSRLDPGTLSKKVTNFMMGMILFILLKFKAHFVSSYNFYCNWNSWTQMMGYCLSWNIYQNEFWINMKICSYLFHKINVIYLYLHLHNYAC